MRRSKLNQIIELLEQEYPEVRCSLNWSTPLELLISTQLSAQCTDARVNLVTPALFERFPDAKAYAEADVTVYPLSQGVQVYSEQGGRTLFSLRSDASWQVRSNTTVEWDLSSQSDSIGLYAYVYPYYGSESANRNRNAIQEVKWTTSSGKIASVVKDEEGNARLVCRNAGTVTVTATAADGRKNSRFMSLAFP